MLWTDSWAECVAWFQTYAADDAYSWGSFFPSLLHGLSQRPSSGGLYAHRWATTVVLSRFAAHPDWADGPKVELLALPGQRIEVKVFKSYNQKLDEAIWHLPIDFADLDSLMRFVAGEGEVPTLARR